MSISQTDVINKLKAKQVALLDLNDLQRLLGVEDRNTAQKLAQRLVQSKTFERIKRGEYLFRYSDKNISDFQLANFLLEPSYVSLESALVYYELIDQFTYQITSITTRKTRTLTAREKTFAYSSIIPEMYWGYTNENEFLIATPEKALVDFIYLSGKTDRPLPKSIHIDKLNKKRLQNYLDRLDSARYARELNKLGVNLTQK